MKWLFLLMVAVNIAIYVWGLQHETGTSTALDPRYRSIGEIKLLTKVDIESPSTEQIPEKDRIDEGVVISEQQAGFEAKLSSTTLDTYEAEFAPETEFASETEFVQEAEPGAEAEPLAKVEEGFAVDASKLEEDGESAETVNSSVAAQVEATEESLQVPLEALQTAEAEAVVVHEIRCWMLGPISERSTAITILEAVEEKVASASLREETEKSITGYWVVLPPYENARTANDVVEQLRAREVSDVQRFYRGEFQNGVSLGVYNQRYNAEKRKAQIETKGFSPDVIPRFKEIPIYWIDYQSENELDIAGIIPSGYPDLAVTQQECKDQLN